MVSKSSAPHSIRFRNDLWERVLERAKRDSVTPNEAVVSLVETGLREPPLSITSDYAKRVEARVAKGGFKPRATPLVEHMDKPKRKPAEPERMTMPKAAYGSRLKTGKKK